MKEVYLSCYESDIFYRFHNLKFYFSSVARRNRFIDNHLQYIEIEKMKFRNKYHIKVDEDSLIIMLGIIFYTKCEKRGFRLEEMNEEKEIKTFYDLPTFKISF